MGSIPLALHLEICLVCIRVSDGEDDHAGSCRWTIRGIMNNWVNIFTQRKP